MGSEMCIRDRAESEHGIHGYQVHIGPMYADTRGTCRIRSTDCLLYTSDAADDMQCGDLCGRRIIKKKNTKKKNFFFFKQKTAYEIPLRLVGSEMCFFFSSRRRHTRCSGVSWARRCV